MLFRAIFEQALERSQFPSGKLLVMAIKYPEPRITLLCAYQKAGEDVDTFKQDFAVRLTRYLTSENCDKSFELMLTIDW